MKDWEGVLLKILDKALHQGKEAVYTSDLVFELKKRGYEDLTAYEVGQTMKDWNFPKTRLDKAGQERKRGWLIKEFLLAPLMGREETGKRKGSSFSDVVGMKCYERPFDSERKVYKPCGWTGFVRLKKGEMLVAVPGQGEKEGSPELVWQIRETKEEEDEDEKRERAFFLVQVAWDDGQKICRCPRCKKTAYAYRPKVINFAGGSVIFE